MTRSRSLLAIGIAFFLGLAALAGWLAIRSLPSSALPGAAVSPPPSASMVASPPPPSQGPQPSRAAAPMRAALNFSVKDAHHLEIGIGESEIQLGERSPKVNWIAEGPASRAGLRVGDRVFKVDGRAIFSAADFERELAGKTVPGEVTFTVGRSRDDTHDLKIVFK